jgi:hypothetical protein
MYIFRGKWHEYDYATFNIVNALAGKPEERFLLNNIKNIRPTVFTAYSHIGFFLNKIMRKMLKY